MEWKRRAWLTLALLLTCVLPARAAVLKLTQDGQTGYLPAINARGQVVWVSSDGEDAEIYLWTGSRVQQLTRNAIRDWKPRINDAGQVVWLGGDYERARLFRWDGTRVLHLTESGWAEPSAASRPLELRRDASGATEWINLQINEAGQVVWAAWDGADREIYLWDGAGIRQLTHNEVDDDFPRLNDAGQVVWTAPVSQGLHTEVFLWTSAMIRQLSRSWIDAHDPQINNQGQVVWRSGRYASGEGSEIYLWDGVHVRRLTNDPGGNLAPQINDAGQVVWEFVGERAREIHLWDGATVKRLTLHPGFKSAPQLNSAGQVVWEGVDDNGSRMGAREYRRICLWDGAAIQRLTGFQESGQTPQISDAGQVVWQGSHDQIHLYTPDTLTDLQPMVFAPPSAIGGASLTGWVTLGRPAPAGGAVVALSSDHLAALTEPSVTVAPGTTTARFSVRTHPVSSGATAVLSASHGGVERTAAVRIFSPSLLSVTLDGTGLRIGEPIPGWITLTGPAPAGGALVALASNPPAAAMVPAAILVAEGATTADFLAGMGQPVASEVEVSAVYGGAVRSARLPSLSGNISLALNPAAIVGGTRVTGTVTLSRPAPAGGERIVLSMPFNGEEFATIPTEVTVPEGAATASFPIATHSVPARRGVSVDAYSARLGHASALLSLFPAGAAALTFAEDPSTGRYVLDRVTGGHAAIGTLILADAAPPVGRTVTLSSDNPDVAAVPASIIVPAGATAVTFPITTSPVVAPVAVTVSASGGGVTQTGTLHVDHPAVRSVTFSPGRVLGGESALGTVMIDGPAAAGGVPLTLVSDSTAVARLPASVVVPAGATTVTFPVTTFPVERTVRLQISVETAGVVSPATLEVEPHAVTSIAFAPHAVAGGRESTGTIVLREPAPAGGAEVRLSTDNPALITLPVSVTVPAGGTRAAFAVTAARTTVPTAAAILASYQNTVRTATLEVLPASLVSFALSRERVPGGATVSGTVTLSDPAPAGGAVITLVSREADIALPPASVTVAPGATTARFAIATAPVAETADVRLTADQGGIAHAATLQVRAPARVSVLLGAAPVVGGALTTGTVQLAESALEGGTVITLASAEPAVLAVPSSVTVPEGATTVTFPVMASPVIDPVLVRVTATSDGGSGHGLMTVVPGFIPAVQRVAVLRPSTREWFIRGEGVQARVAQFGGPADQPVAADYLGSGFTQIAVFRPGSAEWFLRQEGGGAVHVQFGGPIDVPVPGDYFGLGRTQIAVFRSSTAEWFLRTDDGGAVCIPWGAAGDLPVPGDYFGLKRAQVAVFRPGSAEWFLRNDHGEATRFQFGGPEDVPVPGDYFGLGHLQIAVFRPGSSEWFVRTDAGTTVPIQWGGPEDMPVPAAYAPHVGR